MSRNISKIKLNKISIFSICSKKYGYGHFNRSENLKFILKRKDTKLAHFSYGDKFKNKKFFLSKIKSDFDNFNKIILDITNKSFLDSKTINEIKKIFKTREGSNVYIIDAPLKKNLSIALNLKKLKMLVPFEIDSALKKKLSKIKNNKIGTKYFIYPLENIKKKIKIYDLLISFGGSDNYKGSLYVMKLLSKIKIKKRIVVTIGKYFGKRYKKQIISFAKSNNFQAKLFTKKFNNILNKSKILITNSGLTKYEGLMHGMPVIIFSDNKESNKIDKIFKKKTNQIHFSNKRNFNEDKLKLENTLMADSILNSFDKEKVKSNIKKLKNFFENE